MPRRTFTLRTALLALVLLGLLPLAVLGGLGLLTAAETQRQQLEGSTRDLSQALASAVQLELEAQVSAVAAVARSPLLASGDHEAFYAFTKVEAASRPDWRSMALTDGQGRIIFKTQLPFAAPDARVIDPGSLQEVLASGRPTVGRITRGQVRGMFAYPVRVPVRVDGELKYVLTAAVDPNRMLLLAARQGLPDDWVISIFDQDYHRVARSRDHERALGGWPAPSLHRMLSQAHGAPRGSGITVTLEGEETFTGFARVLPYGWTVAVGAPTAVAQSALMASGRWNLLGIALSAAFCAFLATRIARKIGTGVLAARDSAVQLGEGRPVVGFSSHIVEIDEMGRALRTASDQLLQADRRMQHALEAAEGAGRAKDRFLAVLGHELRNPLAPMVTAIHLLERKAPASVSREVAILRRQVHHLKRLVDDLLDATRIANGKLEMNRQAVDVLDVLERALEILPTSDAAPAVTVERPAAPVWVHGDPVRLVQVVTNLLHNALRYGAGHPITLTAAAGGDAVHIVVEDQGVGMTADTLSHIFEPFYQAPQTLQRSSGGLGLGLALVQEVVRAHGGDVTARSDGPGQGAVFDVMLPTIPAPPAKLPSAAVASPTMAMTVLVVDDNADALETLVRTLQLAGHDVRGAATPAAALEMALQRPPALAILDIGLPGMSGHDLARALRGMIASPLYLIALTGYGQPDDKREAAAAGFDLHLTKPVEPAALLEALLALRHSRR